MLRGVLMVCGVLVCASADCRAEEFQPVQPPAWARRCTRMAYVTPGELEDAAAAGVQAVHFNLVWPYYPLRRDGGGLAEADARQLREFVERCHARGIKAILGLPPFLPVNLARKHPEWRVFFEDNDRALHIEPQENDLGTRLGCNQGPWGEYLIELLVELVQDYDLDGYSFDGNYHPPICYAPHAKAAYRRDTGRELPAQADLHDVAYREYLVWRGEQLERHYATMQRRLKAVKPDAVVMSWSVNGGRYGHFLHSPRAMPTRLNLLLDLPMQEWWLDETNLGASVLPAFGVSYLRATTGRRLSASESYLMSRGNPYGTDSFPKLEYLARSRWVMTNGAIPPEALGWSGHKETALQILRETRELEPYLVEIEDIPWAALLVSEQTRQFYAYRDIAGIFLPPVLGVFRTTYEEHLPLSLLNDWDLQADELAKYRVVVLAGAAALSDRQVQAVREYVARGGGLVATGETSLCDELGRPQQDFALADVFGASYRGRPQAVTTPQAIDVNFAIALDDAYWRQRVGSALLRWPGLELWRDERLQELTPYRQVRTKGPGVKVAPGEGTTIAAEFVPDGAPPGTFLPGVVTRTFGQGRVVYLATDLAAGYWSYGYPYQRRMLRRVLEWAAGAAPPIAVQAPMSVQTTFYRQRLPEGERWLIHRYNGLNTTGGHGLPAVDVPLREEVVPIHGVTLSWTGRPPRRVTLQPGDRPVPWESAGDRQHVALPPLELHDIVVVEFDAN